MKIVTLLFLLIFTHQAFSQYTSEESNQKEKNPLSKLQFKDRLYTGGNVAFSAQNSWFFVEASPYVGYRVTHNYSVGLGAKYIYVGSRQQGVNWSIYGGSLFNRYKFNESLFAHAEFEFLRAYDLNPNSPNYYARDYAKMFFIGAGYNSSIGGAASIQIMVLYDLIDDVNSPYQSNYLFGPVGPPIVYRVGINIGM